MEGSGRSLIVLPSLHFHSATEKDHYDLNQVGGCRVLSSSEALPESVQRYPVQYPWILFIYGLFNESLNDRMV